MGENLSILLVSGLCPPWHKGGPDIVAYELHKALRKKGVNSILLAEAPIDLQLDDIILTKHFNNIFLDLTSNFFNKHLRIRHIINEFDIMHFEILPGIKYLFFTDIAEMLGVKVVATLHGSPIRDVNLKERMSGKILSLFNCRVALRNISRIKHIIVNSHFMKEIIKEDLAIDGYVIRNGVDINRFMNRDLEPPIPLEGEYRILFWGRISNEKGIDILIKSAKSVVDEYPSCHYYILGDGPKLASMKKLAFDLNINKNVHFLGFRDHDEISALASRSDIIILPFNHISNISDNAPLTVMEAMATGKAIITTRVGGVPELIQDGINGLLAEPDPLDITNKTILLIEDTKMRNRLGNHAFVTAESHSWDRISELYIKFYREII